MKNFKDVRSYIKDDYAQDLDLAQKNMARLAKQETGQDKKDYESVARALNQGNLGAVKKVIKGISTKEIQADILNVLVGYNDLIAKMYPKAMSGGKFKSGMTVDKMIKEDEEINERVTYPKTMKDIVRRYGKELKQAERTGNIDRYLSTDAEEALKHWVFKNEPYVGDDPDDFDEWLDDNLEDIVKGRIKEEKEINEGLPNQKELEKDIMAFMKDGRSDGITGLTGISKSLEQKYKVGPAVARSAVKKLIGDIVDGKYKG